MTVERGVRVAIVVSTLLAVLSLSSCVFVDELANCSDSDIAQTDRAAQHVWQVLDSSNPGDGAYCDSSPYPYFGGSMDGPAEELVARATDELGCAETTVEGFDSEDAAHLACDFEGTSYLLEIALEVDPHRPSPGLEVGLYKR